MHISDKAEYSTGRCRTATETHGNILIQSILTSHFERERGKVQGRIVGGGGGGGGHEGDMKGKEKSLVL